MRRLVLAFHPACPMLGFMADFLDVGGERAKQMRRADTLARLRAVELGAADRIASAALSDPDPDRINLGLLRAFFERRAAARAARVRKRVEAVFRAFFRLPGHQRQQAAKLLLAGARRPFLARLFRRSI